MPSSKFSEMLFLALGAPLLRMIREAYRSQAFYLCANVARSSFVVGHRILTSPRSLILFEGVFCLLSGAI
jgi:hypothetical protein